MKNYKVVNGTSYSEGTPDAVIRVLERARENRTRIRVRYGFTETHEDVRAGKAKAGLDWLDEHDCEGTVGRSMGPTKVPLLIYNARSMGGGAVLDDCIVAITDTRAPRTVLYEHPAYHHAEFKVVLRDKLVAETEALKTGRGPLYYEVVANRDAHARFESHAKAQRWVRKMSR